MCSFPASILYKSIAGRYRPVNYPDGPITARYRFIKNACWVVSKGKLFDVYCVVRTCYQGTFYKSTPPVYSLHGVGQSFNNWFFVLFFFSRSAACWSMSYFFQLKENLYTFRDEGVGEGADEESLSKMLFLHSEKLCTLKGKNSHPTPYSWTLFQKVLVKPWKGADTRLLLSVRHLLERRFLLGVLF